MPILKSGYTLIELMVTMTIISILSVFVYANFNNFSKVQVLTRASDQIKSVLRQAQNNASSGVRCVDETAADWFVKIESLKIHLMCRKLDTAADITVKTQTFETNVVIEDINTKGSGNVSICDSFNFSDAVPFFVVYRPIFQKIDFIYARSSSPACVATEALTAEIIIKDISANNSRKTFIINRGGAVIDR